MIREVVVETNWLWDVVLQQDGASQELFDHAGHRALTLFLPSFALAEAIKTLEAKQHGWRALAQDLARAQRELERSDLTRDPGAQLQGALDALGRLDALIEARFWSVLTEVAGIGQIVEPTHEVVRLTTEIRDSLRLSPADSAVLATVVSLHRAGRGHVFLSRDRQAFGSQAVLDYMTREGVTYHDSANPIVGPLRRREGSP